MIGFIGGVVFGKYVGFKFYYCELLLKGNFFLKDWYIFRLKNGKMLWKCKLGNIVWFNKKFLNLILWKIYCR